MCGTRQPTFFPALVLSFIFPLVILFSLSGCVTQESASAKSTTDIQKQPAIWSIVLSISGGFAGLARNISIDSNGLLIINDLKLNKSIRNKLDNNELARLSELINNNKNQPSMAGIPFGSENCADCFQYKLSIRWQNGQQLAVLNDINLPQSPYKELLLVLRKLTSKYYK